MAACRDIIASALRKAGQLGLGETPDYQELEEGRALLVSLYAGWITSGLFGPLTDIIADADATAGENQRILAGSGVTITLPTTITDECSDEARPPRNRSVVMIARADDTTEYHIYSGVIGGWQRIDRLLTNDTEAPLSNMGSDGLASCLAEVIAGELGQPITPMTARNAALFRLALATSYDSPRQPLQAEFY